MNSSSGAIRLWAGFDLLVTAILALPPTALFFVQVLYAVNGWLGGAGSPPPFDPVHLLFVCLMGGLGVLWAVVRLIQPRRFLGLADAWARLWVTGLLGYFVFIAGAPLVLCLFMASELLGAAHQFLVLRKAAT